MDILVFNQDWFKTELESAGHRIVTCGTRSHLDILLPHPMLSLDYVLSRCPSDFQPERIVVFDESAPLLVVGIEESRIPTLFYSVDVQHHHQIHRHLALNFSKTLVAQRDYLHLFSEIGATAEWLPLWSSRTYAPSTNKKYDVVFVGTMDKQLNPDRVAFFDELQSLVPVKCMQGEFWKIFPHAHIVMNQTVKGDLNFRVFEAMMSGTLLLTEETPNGLLDLFVPGEHFATYRKNDPHDAAAKIQELLADTDRCRQIGLAGRKEILARHTSMHRAATLIDLLETLEPPENPVRFYTMLPNYHWLYRRVKEIDTAVALRTLSYSMSLIRRGLEQYENFSEDLAMNAIFACVEYDSLMHGTEGAELLEILSGAYPVARVFTFAHIWNLLNKGQRSEADRLMQTIFPHGITERYHDIHGMMSSIIGLPL